jgi:2-dehydro-3-deoxyphosphogluconate aldolase/(4S)-4-hydroxy-2-oxoglutarate aldolase
MATLSPTLEQLRLTGLVPVIAIQDAQDAEALAKALLQGGLPCAEVTFRTAAAQDSIRRIAKAVPDMLLGAGTVLTIEQVKTALDCGARYIVSPGLNRKVVEYCLSKSVAVTPGVATPSDLEVALELGLEVVKFFPAEANGGLAYLKALSGPYGSVRFIPTGGIDESNLLPYLKFGKTLACGGSWMVKPELISAKQFDKIRELTARAVQLMLGFTLEKMAFAPDETLAGAKLATLLSNLMLVPVRENDTTHQVGTQFEVWKKRSAGFPQHLLVVGTHFPDRALFFLKRNGILPLEGGKITLAGGGEAVRLNVEVGGFAVALSAR